MSVYENLEEIQTVARQCQKEIEELLAKIYLELLALKIAEQFTYSEDDSQELTDGIRGNK